MALNIDDPSLKDSFKEVTEVKSEKNWLLYVVDGKDLKLSGTGTGGLEELKTKFDQSKVYFGVLKVVGKDIRKNVESLRNKLVFFTFIGNDVSVTQRAKVSVMRADVEKIINSYAIRLDVDGSLSSLSTEHIMKELLRSGGAHMPTHYVFGPGQEIEVQNLK